MLLLWINQGWAHPVLDGVFSWLSSRAGFALPFALVLLALFAWRWRKIGIQLWLLLIFVVGAGDFLGNLLKGLLAEVRPCYALAAQLRQLDRAPGVGCGPSLTGMPSNHALNAFATATFLSLVLGGRAVWLFVFAALVALSRVYLGKHYPSQVGAGALIGLFWGLASAWLGLNYLPFVKRIRSLVAAGHSRHAN